MTRRYVKVTEEELQKIRELSGQGYNDENIATLLNRPVQTIRRKRVGMGLPRKPIHTPMTLAKKSASLRRTMIEETGHFMNYTAMVNRVRAAHLGWPGYALTEALILHTLEKCGALETPEIIERVVQRKTEEAWKPYHLSNRRFYTCLVVLRRDGLIETVYNDRQVPNRRLLPNKYDLTQKARQQVEKREWKRGSTLDEMVLALEKKLEGSD